MPDCGRLATGPAARRPQAVPKFRRASERRSPARVCPANSGSSAAAPVKWISNQPISFSAVAAHLGTQASGDQLRAQADAQQRLPPLDSLGNQRSLPVEIREWIVGRHGAAHEDQAGVGGDIGKRRAIAVEVGIFASRCRAPQAADRSGRHPQKERGGKPGLFTVLRPPGNGSGSRRTFPFRCTGLRPTSADSPASSAGPLPGNC